MQRIVLRDLRWLFREQPKHDQGIDAHVEVAVDGHGTGRLIALQIKAGKSQFRATSGGWSFYYSARERDLWRGHALPVMVVLVDVDSDDAYWQRIGASTERATKTRYVVHVPRHQTVKAASDAWLLAASGLDERAAESFPASLGALPPSVVSVLTGPDAPLEPARLLALHLAEGRDDPSGTALDLIDSRPWWMEGGDAWAWRALASYCAEHEKMEESARALLLAAENAGAHEALRLAAAALHFAQVDPTRAAEVLRRARASGEVGALGLVVDHMLTAQGGHIEMYPLATVFGSEAQDVRDDPTVQSFLAEHSLLCGRTSIAVRHAERALELVPEGTEQMARLASALAKRSGTLDALPDDLLRASNLFQRAIEQRRRWRGRTELLLSALGSCLFELGDNLSAVKWLAPAPFGTATDTESRNPRLLRTLIGAAHFAGNEELRANLLLRVDGHRELALTLARLGLSELDDVQLTALWQDELADAERVGELERIVNAVFRLATHGVNVTDHFDPFINSGDLVAGAKALPSAIAALKSNHVEGLRRLRGLAAEDPLAALNLIDELLSRDLPSEAVLAAEAAYAHFRTPQWRTRLAHVRFRLAPDAAAEEELREALLLETVPIERVGLASRLASILIAREDWTKAEDLLTMAATAVTPPAHHLVWRLAEVQLRAHRGSRAAATLARYDPKPASHDEAVLWARVMTQVPWDAWSSAKALDIAAEFAGDPQLATYLLGHLVTTTRAEDETGTPASDEQIASYEEDVSSDDSRPPVPGDLHSRAFEQMSILFTEYGAESGIQIISTVATEGHLEQIGELVKKAQLPDLTDLLEQVSQAQLPIGALAPVFSSTYAAVLIYRVAGQLVSASANDLEHGEEVLVARSALGGKTVVDISTMLVLSRITDAEALRAGFGGLVTTPSALGDIQRESVELASRSASKGSLRWDVELERPVFRERPVGEQAEAAERLACLRDTTRFFTPEDVRPTTLLSDLPDRLAGAPWVDALRLARQASAPLWCDDLAVRRLARSVGLTAFSTLALSDALRDDWLAAASTNEEIDSVVEFAGRVTSDLLRECVVDIPVTHEQLMRQAEADSWRPGAAAVAVSRPTWWTWSTNPLLSWREVLNGVRAHSPQGFDSWQRAFMKGASRISDDPKEIRTRLARLALVGIGEDLTREPPVSDLAVSFRNARAIAEARVSVEDPFGIAHEVAAELTSLGLKRSGDLVDETARELAEDLTTLGSGSALSDRDD